MQYCPLTVAFLHVQVTLGCLRNSLSRFLVTISFDIDAHEYNGRWFNEIRAYNVTRGQAPVAAAPGVAPAQASPFPPQDANAPFPPAQEPAGEGSTDDLPF